MEKVKIRDGEYYFAKDYKNDDELRKSFIELAKKTFCIDFNQWYDRGYWNDRFIQYSIIDKESVVANVSVYIMHFNLFGEDKLCIQLGGVMTDEKYRGRGFSRFLIERVINDWKDKSDMIYLFANDSVLDFYPKFGFVKEDEYIYCKSLDLHLYGHVDSHKKLTEKSYRKLNIDNKEERKLLYDKAMYSAVNSKAAMIKDADLVMFYCLSFMKDNIYYFQDINTIAIAEAEGDTLVIDAVYSDKEAGLDVIIERLAGENIRKVELGFTPNDTSSYECELYDERDTTLFILGGSREFDEDKIKFESLSHT